MVKIDLISHSFVSFSNTGTVLKLEHALWVFLLHLNIIESCFVAVVEHYFVKHQIFEVFFRQGVLFKVEIKWANRFGRGLVIRIVQLLQILVLESVFNCYTLFWVVS